MTKKRKKKFRSAKEIKEFSLEEFSMLTEGVIFISETDAGLDPFVEKQGTQDLREKLISSASDFEEIPFEKFFDRLTAKREWHTAADQKRTAAFSRIRKYLEGHMTDLRVIRTGKVRIDILVFGKTPDGLIAGFRTRAVET